MTIINGKINGSISGIIRATPDSPFVDTSTNPDTLVILPVEAAIANGNFSITIPQSQNLGGQGIITEGVTWYFEQFQTKTTIAFYQLSGVPYVGATHNWTTDNQWYTGSVHATSSVRLDRVETTVNELIPGTGIHAIVPDLASIDYTSLVGIAIQTNYLDVSLYRLAEMLTTIATYRDRISSKFTPRGAYNAATSYVYGDLVNYNGASYLWINSASLAGKTPPATNDTWWFQLASKGAAGGTGAQIVGYNATTWANSTEAAAREDVRAAIAAIPNPDLSLYLTIAAGLPRNNATMTGTSKRAALTYPVAAAEKASEIPTTQYVEDAIAALSNPLGVIPRPLVYARRVAEQAIGKDVSTSVLWDNRVIGSSMLATNGDFTVPATGSYLFHSSLLYEMDGNIGANNSRTIFELLVSRWSTTNSAFVDAGNIIFENEPSTAGLWRSRRQGWRYLADAVANDIYSFRAKASGVGINSGNSISPGGNTGQNNYLLIWRVS